MDDGGPRRVVSLADTAGDAARFIREYVAQNDWVSFAELHNHMGGFFEGEFRMMLPPVEDSHVVIWVNMSGAFLDALDACRSDGSVHLAPGSAFNYFIDGEALKLPVAKRAHYKHDDHWLPMFLRPGPQEDSR